MRQRWWALVPTALVALVCVAVFRPVFGYQITGDVYQMVQIAHEGCFRPLHLIAPIGQFFRPVSTFSLAFDLAVWGRNPAGFHLTTLLIHCIAGLALLAAARTLGLGRLSSTAVALLWVISPFTDENAIWAAIRHENALLLAWLVIVVSWPGPGNQWTRGRVAGVIGGTFFAVASKETWIATPFLFGALELVRCRFAWRSATIWAAGSGLAAMSYVAARFLAFPSVGDYYQWSALPLAKLPHLMAAFLWLEELVPVVDSVSWRGVVACVVVAAAGFAAIRLRVGPAVVGFALLLPPLGPTLFVPYLPQRYAAIPWAGFLLIAAGLGQRAFLALRPDFRRWAAIAAGALVMVLGSTSILMVRADLADWKRISDAHLQLLGETREIIEELPTDCAIAMIRLEGQNPLLEIINDPIGLRKMSYIRPKDPYGLVDSAALLEWVRDEDGLLVRSRDDWSTHFNGTPGSVLFHLNGGFKWSEDTEEDLASTVRKWEKAGRQLQVVEVEFIR